jgi:SynChlorMet cassette protein ScmC
MNVHPDQNNIPASKRTSFHLRLRNGQGWNIIVEKSLSPWLENFARIMELSPYKKAKYTNLICLRSEKRIKEFQQILGNIKSGLNIELPAKGWHADQLTHAQLWTSSETSDVIYEIIQTGVHSQYQRMWQALFPIYLKAQKEGGLPIHAAFIERDGKGFLLSGPGGSGKSTCSRRVPPPWKAHSDDETLIVKSPQGYFAHPFPTWSEYLQNCSKKTWNVRLSLPVEAILFIKKSKKDKIEDMKKSQAAVYLYDVAFETILWGRYERPQEENKSLNLKLLDSACQLVRDIPTYFLHVSKKGRFWENIEEKFF